MKISNAIDINIIDFELRIKIIKLVKLVNLFLIICSYIYLFNVACLHWDLCWLVYKVILYTSCLTRILLYICTYNSKWNIVIIKYFILYYNIDEWQFYIYYYCLCQECTKYLFSNFSNYGNARIKIIIIYYKFKNTQYFSTDAMLW